MISFRSGFIDYCWFVKSKIFTVAFNVEVKCLNFNSVALNCALLCMWGKCLLLENTGIDKKN